MTNAKQHEVTAKTILNTMFEVASCALHVSYRKREIFLDLCDYLYSVVKYKSKLIDLITKDPELDELHTKINNTFTRAINENDNKDKVLRIKGKFTVIGHLFHALRDEARYYNLSIDLNNNDEEEFKNEFIHG
jgi:hypothetical protein